MINKLQAFESTQIIRSKFLILFLSLLSTPFWAQTQLDKFQANDAVTSIVVNKKMFDMMSKVKIDASDKELQQYFNLVKKLDHLKVFATKNTQVETEMKTTAQEYAKALQLDEVMQLKDKGRVIQISAKMDTVNAGQIKELLMFIDGHTDEESVLMSLVGNFNWNDLALLTDKIRFPGGEDLKKATQGK